LDDWVKPIRRYSFVIAGEMCHATCTVRYSIGVVGNAMIASDTEALQRISAIIPPSETLLWAGKPARGLRFRLRDLFFVAFGLFWLGFGLVFGWASFSVGSVYALSFGLFFGVCSLLAGFYLVIGRHVFDAWVRARTVYGLTDRRVAIISKSPSPTLVLIDLKNITSIHLQQERDGEGTIDMSTDIMECSGDSQCKKVLSFEFISEAANVHELVQNAKACVSGSLFRQ
jgi:hypothetical protein